MTPSALMIHLTPGQSNEKLLQLGADLAERLKVSQVVGIAGCQPVQVYGEGSFYVSGDILDLDRAEIDKELGEAEAAFRAAFVGKPARLEWRSTVDYRLIADYIANEMRAADLLLTMPEQEVSVLDTSRRVLVADLVLRTGRPILVANPEVSKLDLDNVVVGWKESREARRALHDALPLLALAGRVTVLEIAAEEDMPEARRRVGDVVSWLMGHDIAASGRTTVSRGNDAAELAAQAEELKAGLLVGGAYGHNRLRELVLGGVTRDLLLKPARCSFISH
ncbi:Universal stress protein family protein [Enhydrobacter aerosaccus]|uniref:Universal stress protein family protein n=1 Tax=Enhydrobacter aerosaccus TaxID=225324 RepID=A0A1T4SQ05_9HYPH|nr:universal stress protein [Enhydrobacter aerosaccus]SKA30236.1 Universal stress protein family protein [Enhydrobacter aerosaccus]